MRAVSAVPGGDAFDLVDRLELGGIIVSRRRCGPWQRPPRWRKYVASGMRYRPRILPFSSLTAKTIFAVALNGEPNLGTNLVRLGDSPRDDRFDVRGG